MIRLVITIAFLSIAAIAQTAVVRAVIDARGAAIAGASIRCSGSPNALAKTAADGTFTIDPGACTSGRFEAEAARFGAAKFDTTASTIILSPRPVDLLVTVTNTQNAVGDSTASVAILPASHLANSPALTLDDRLRQVPGFTLFRRSGSRTANPTTQGVSLRGVGASGASRALMLKNDIPLNDPFGSWIYWGRLVSASISEVEILRGSGGDIYGTAAVGGVIAVRTMRPGDKTILSADASLGDGPSPFASVFASTGRRWLRGSLASEVFKGKGYIPVAKEFRGAIDTEANVRRSTVEPTIEFKLNDSTRAFVTGEFYREVRQNGTPLQNNDTRMNMYSAGLDQSSRRGGLFTLRLFGGRELYHQSFSAIAANRQTETLNRRQTVPVDDRGLRLQWTFSRETASIFAGAHFRKVSATSREAALSPAGTLASFSISGGTERSVGIYGGVSLRPVKRLVLDFSSRYDRWRESEGASTTFSPSGLLISDVRYPDRTESAFSPRAGILFRFNKNVAVAASASRSFRAATLNELYRPFRVGNVLTLANANLRAERGTTFEGAIVATALRDRLYMRTGPYCTTIAGPVSNVTISTTPSLITRQRQNLGSTRTCGFEADMQLQITPSLNFSGGYLFANARVRDAGTTGLAGRLLPQIPRHTWNVLGVFSRPRFGTLSVQLRGSSGQFEDDQNTIALQGFAAADVLYSRPLTKHFSVYAAVENVLNTRIEAGRNPVLTLGQPRTARVGFRFRQ